MSEEEKVELETWEKLPDVEKKIISAYHLNIIKYTEYEKKNYILNRCRRLLDIATQKHIDTNSIPLIILDKVKMEAQRCYG